MDYSPQELESRIVAIQQSTSTAFPAFARAHNYLRMKSRWYYNWHVKPYAKMVHISVAVAYVLSIPFGMYTYFSNPGTTFASSQIMHSSQADWQAGTVDTNLDMTTTAGDVTLKQPAYTDSIDAKVHQVFNYTTSSTPAIPNATTRELCMDSTNNLIYIATSTGLTVLKTQGTPTSTDDTIHTTYTTSTTPALASNNVVMCEFDSANNLIYLSYLSSSNKTIQVLDTKGTLSPTDDVVATVRTTTNGSNALYIDTTTSYLYIGAVNTTPNVIIINTNSTGTIADDVVVHTKSLSNSYWVSRFYMDHSHNRLYIGMGTGVQVYNTQGTNDFTDDTLIGTYSASGTPSIPLPDSGNNVVGLLVDPINDLVYIGYRNVYPGMVLIHTQQSSSSLAGDTKVTDYSSIGMNSVYTTSFALDPAYNRFYMGSANDGIYEFDTKGTATTSDDTMVQHLTFDSVPALPSGALNDIKIDSTTHTVFSTSGGLNALSQDNKYLALSTVIESDPFALASTPSEKVRWTQTSPAGSTVSLQTRTATGVTDRNEFDDNNTNDYLGDYYSWGSNFGTATESNGTLKLSNPNPASCCTNLQYVDMWFDTGFGRANNFYSADATVILKMRVNSATVQESPLYDNEIFLFTDDWEGAGTGVPIVPNEWITISLTEPDGSPFSRIGLEVEWLTGTWSPGDTLEIDYIEVQSRNPWGAWGTACTTNSGCAIADTSGQDFIQYRLNMATNTVDTSPVISAVTFSDGYPASGTYASAVIDGAATVDWVTLVGDATTPSGTAVTYQTRTGPTVTPDGSWSDWQDATSSIASPDNRYLQYKAVLTSSDDTATPTLASVTLAYDPITESSGSPTTLTTPTPTPATTSIPVSANLNLSLLGLSDLNFANVRLPREIKYAVTNTKLTFSGAVVPGAKVTVKNDTTTWCSAVGDAQGKWTCQLAEAVPYGDYTVRIGAVLGADTQNMVPLALTLVAEDQGHSGPATVEATPTPAPASTPTVTTQPTTAKPYTAQVTTDSEGKRVLSTLKVSVTDPNGNPLANIPVELRSEVQSATTDAEGVVTFSNVTIEKHNLKYASLMVGGQVVVTMTREFDLNTIIPDASAQEVTLNPIHVETTVIAISVTWWALLIVLIVIAVLFGAALYWRDRSVFRPVLRRMTRFRDKF